MGRGLAFHPAQRPVHKTSCTPVSLTCGCAPCELPSYDCAVFGPLAFVTDLTACLAGVVFDLGCPANDWCKVKLRIRKRGFAHMPNKFLLEYPAFALEGTRIVFRFDKNIERLLPSRYEVVLFDDCRECGSFELRVTNPCLASLRAFKELPYHTVAPALRRPEGANSMFDGLSGFDVASCALWEVGGTGLPLSPVDQALLCARLIGVCRPVELIVDDGVNRETVKVSGCVGGVPQVQRAQGSSRQQRFAKGSRIRFEWTSTNVSNMFLGCP